MAGAAAFLSFKTDILYKKFIGVPDSGPGTLPSNEAGISKTAVVPSLQIYQQPIPSTRPDDWVLDQLFNSATGNPSTAAFTKMGFPSITTALRKYSAATNYIVYYQYIPLIGTNSSQYTSFYYSSTDANNILKYAVPSNYDVNANTYNVISLWGNDGTAIPPTDPNYPWIFDPDSGVVTFYYNSLFSTALYPPIMSFIRYEGALGIQNLSIDISMNKKLSVGGDLSLNGRLFASSNIYLPAGGNVYVGGAVLSTGGGGGGGVFDDISANGRLFVGNDASMGGNLYLVGGITQTTSAPTGFSLDNTFYTRLFVNSDVSFNGNLYTSGRTILNGDVSMNSRLYVGRSTQFNDSITMTSGTASNNYKNLYGKAPPQNVYLSSVSPNTTNATSSTWINNNITWTATSTSESSTRGAFILFNTNNADAGWADSGSYSNTSPYSYTGTSFSTNITGIGSIAGNWIQLQSSVPIIMNNYSFYQLTGGAQAPGTYYICGSNDNNAWYPLIKSVATAVGNQTSVYTIPSGTTSTSGTVSNITYNSYGYGSNSYNYFRLVISNLTSTANTYAVFYEWTPNFSVPSSPGPSSGLLYMDASNINQIDVSGSLGLINSAPTMTVTPNTTGVTAYTWQNNNVTWEARASSTFGGSSSYQGFSTINNINTFVWVTSAASYTGTGGAYTGPTTANYTTVIQGGPGTIYGEWLQLQSSVPVIMNRYNFNSQYGAASFQGRLPKVYYICGSNDGSTWFPIQYVTFTSTPVASSTVTTASQPTATYTINTITTQQTQNASTSVYCYSTSLNAYTYFRLVVTSAIYTSTLTGASAFTGDGYLAFFWYLNFSPVTSSVSMALDIGAPNQLNVGGAMNVAGALSVADQIQFSYTSLPTFSSTSLGYIITGTITGATLTAGTLATISSISLTAGVWAISFSVLYTSNQSTTSDCLIDLYNSSVALLLTQCTGAGYQAAQGPRQFGPYSYILSTAAATISLRGNPSTNTAISGVPYSFLRAVRIA